jgi:uncharacterized protein (TIGR02145 family)
VGGKMKATTVWDPPNTGATNASGFAGLPGGSRNHLFGDFNYLGFDGYWWSSSEGGAGLTWYRYLTNDGAGVGRNANYDRMGYCVRCVKD